MKKFKMIKLSTKDRRRLWGEVGPYSEAKLIVNTRILDDEVSRVFLEIELYINPYTFELVKKNRKEFKNDPLLQSILNDSEYRGLPDGYVSCVFTEHYVDEKVMEEAKKYLECAKEVIIKMHKFTLTFLNASTLLS